MWTYGVGDTPKKLKLATWNVNGIRAIITKGSLQSYLNTAQPDIICLN
jgi:exodeoxyribonuclease-3